MQADQALPPSSQTESCVCIEQKSVSQRSRYTLPGYSGCIFTDSCIFSDYDVCICKKASLILKKSLKSAANLMIPKMGNSVVL